GAVLPRRDRGRRGGECVAIAVEADEARGAGGEHRAGVAAEADGTVDEQTAALRLQMPQDGVGHHGHVRQMPNSDSARASSSVYASRWSLVRKRSWFQTSRQLTCPSTSTSPAIV